MVNLKWLPALALATQLQASIIDLGEDRMSFSEGFTLTAPETGGHTSLDLHFNNSVHIFFNTKGFSVGLAFLCSPTNFMTGTGELLDINGNSLGVTTLGSAITSDGWMIAGMFPTSKPLDFYGVHFELDIPATTIVNGGFYFSAFDYIDRGQRSSPFRIGPHIPESGTTLTLFVIALIFLLAFYDQKTTR